VFRYKALFYVAALLIYGLGFYFQNHFDPEGHIIAGLGLGLGTLVGLFPQIWGRKRR